MEGKFTWGSNVCSMLLMLIRPVWTANSPDLIEPRMEGMGTEGPLWRHTPVQLPNQVPCAVLLVRQGAWLTVKRVFAVGLHRIMAKPELPAFRQPRFSFEPLSTMLQRAASAFDVGGDLLRQVRIVGLTATCEGLHGLSLRSPKAMASTVRSSIRLKARTERVAQPSGDTAM